MQSSDTIIVQGLSVSTLIGVHAWEKHLPQKIVLNLELGCDTRSTSKTDDLLDAIDYQAVVDSITDFTKTNHFNLVETLAEKLCELLFDQFKVLSIKLELLKPGGLSNTQAVGVRIERSNPTL